MPVLGDDARAKMAAPSLAGTMEARIGWTTEGPQYKYQSEQLMDALRVIHMREARRVRTARAALVVQALNATEQHVLSKVYPEFAVVWAGMYQPPHPLYVASRALANEHMRVALRSLVGRVVHIGDNLINTAFAGDRDVAFDVDASFPPAMHEVHEAATHFYAMSVDSAGMINACGRTFDPYIVQDWLEGNLYVRNTHAVAATDEAEGLIVDGTMYPMSVTQYMGTMMQTGALLGEFVLPFHPCMLVQPEAGELPDTGGVLYEINDTEVVFKYPEGVVGVTAYDFSVWHEWLGVSHRVFRWGKQEQAFCFELRKPRGSFLHVSVARMDAAVPAPTRSLHALELCDTGGLVVMTAWRLRGIGLDPSLESSWEQYHATHNQMVLDKIYEFALSLKPNELHVHKVFQRLSVMGRRVVSATGVTTDPTLAVAPARDLAAQIHALAFVKRYEAGKVVGDVKAKLDMLCGFSKLSRGQRFMYTIACALNGAFDAVFRDPMEKFRERLDAWRDWLVPRHAAILPQFKPMPTFVTFDVSRESWLAKWAGHAKSLRANDAVLAGLRGALVAQVAATGTVPADPDMADPGRLARDVSDYVDVREGEFVSEEHTGLASIVAGLAPMGRESYGQHHYEVAGTELYVENPQEYIDARFDPVSDYVDVLSELHETVFPGYENVDLNYDDPSLYLDEQEWALAADFLKMPDHVPRMPEDREVYKSWIKAFGKAKAVQTLPGTLAGLAARNMADPRLALAQDKPDMIRKIWNNFLDTACVPDARQRLARFKCEVIDLTEEAYASWTTQATPDKLKGLRTAIEETGKAFEDMDVSEYLAMLKADYKPPLSQKPLKERVEPQVIVYHEKVLSSLYSSLFRLVRERFMSLLLPKFRVVLRKGTEEVRQFMRDNHPWNLRDVIQFLENDFSKYDKSQGEFAFMLEEFVFRELGLSEELLEKWVGGHVQCSIRAVSVGITLHVMYQRKSGDATTALGNVILNMLSVLYAYAGSDIKWGVFMGDDSLLCVGKHVITSDAPQILAEIFNLQAKYFVTSHPYFASHFALFDYDRKEVEMVPDPLKIVQRWSQPVAAYNPRWAERYESAAQRCDIFRFPQRLGGLNEAIIDRYAVDSEHLYDFKLLTAKGQKETKGR